MSWDIVKCFCGLYTKTPFTMPWTTLYPGPRSGIYSRWWVIKVADACWRKLLAHIVRTWLTIRRGRLRALIPQLQQTLWRQVSDYASTCIGRHTVVQLAIHVQISDIGYSLVGNRALEYEDVSGMEALCGWRGCYVCLVPLYICTESCNTNVSEIFVPFSRYHDIKPSRSLLW